MIRIFPLLIHSPYRLRNLREDNLPKNIIREPAECVRESEIRTRILTYETAQIYTEPLDGQLNLRMLPRVLLIELQRPVEVVMVYHVHLADLP